MANIKVELNHPLIDGESVTFKAPCDSTAVTGLKIYYPNVTESSSTTQNKTFTFRDAHGNSLTGVGNLFVSGVYVKVILDTTNNYAYIQNADTNMYVENKFASIISVQQNTLTTNGWVLSGNRYYQTISVANVTANTELILVDCALNGSDLDADATVLEAWGENVSGHNVNQGSGTLTFYSYEVPTINIPINIGVSN